MSGPLSCSARDLIVKQPGAGLALSFRLAVVTPVLAGDLKTEAHSGLGGKKQIKRH
jgi:hypothetical protein